MHNARKKKTGKGSVTEEKKIRIQKEGKKIKNG